MGARGWSLIGLALVAAAIAWPSAARSADKVCVEHPAVQDDSVVCVRDNWQTVDVCDRKDDGHRTFARVVTKSTYPAYRSPYYDSNDSAAGCSNLHFGSQVGDRTRHHRSLDPDGRFHDRRTRLHASR